MYKYVCVPALCAVSAFAQYTVSSDKEKAEKRVMKAGEAAFGPIGITSFMAGPVSAVSGAPYSADAVTQRLQMLPDGNRISQTTTSAIARDSQGRVRREDTLPQISGGPEPPHFISIEDPVANLHITLDPNAKTAFKMSTPSLKKEDEFRARTTTIPAITADRTFFSMPDSGPGASIQFVTAGGPGHDSTSTLKTDLGVQSIEGVMAQGTKVTHTLAAGSVGNDLPIIITTETWYSPELKILVMSKSTDPRMGDTTYKLTNLSRAEPDPALFQIPADYATKDAPAAFTFHSDIKEIKK